MDNIDNFLDNLDKESKIKSGVEKYFYEDRFLNNYKFKYHILELNHAKLDVTFNCSKKGGKYDNNNSMEELVRSVVKRQNEMRKYALWNETYQDPIRQTLFKDLFDFINKKYKINYNKSNSKSNSKSYIITDKSYEKIHTYLPTKKYEYNSKIKGQYDLLILYFELPAELAEKNKQEYMYIVGEAINNVKKGGDLILRIHFAPWLDDQYELYNLLATLFKETTLIYPTGMGHFNNLIFFVLKNKLSDEKIPSDKIWCVKVKNNLKNDKNQKIMELSKLIFKQIDYDMLMHTNLLLLKLQNKTMYTVVKNKLLAKILTLKDSNFV